MGIHRVTDSERAGAISHVDVRQDNSTMKRMESKRECEKVIREEIEP